MKLLRTIVLILSAAALCLAVLVVVYAQLTLTPQKVQKTFSAEIAEYLQREVSFGSIQIGFLGEIRMRDVVLRKSFDWEEDDVLVCSEVKLQVRLLPLLINRLFIKGAVFDSPQIRFFQREVGQFISFYGRIGKRRAISSSQRAALYSVIFLPGHVEVRNGTIMLKSIARELPRPISVSLDQVRLLISDVSALFSFPFSVTARINGSAGSVFTVSGALSVPKRSLTADISLSNTDLAAFRDYLNIYKIPIQGGSVRFDSKLQLEKFESLKLNGNVYLQGITAGMASFPGQEAKEQVYLEGAEATLHFATLWDIPKQLITLQKIEGTVLSGAYHGEGFIRGIGSSPYLKVVLKADDFPLENVSRYLPRNLPFMLDQASITGKADLALNMEGKLPDSVFSRFSISFKGNRINYKPLGGYQPDLEGTGLADSTKISLSDVKIGVKKSTITLAGEIRNYLRGAPVANIRIVSSNINAADFLLSTTTSLEEAEKEEVGPFDLSGLTLGGPIDMGSVSVLGMAINNLTGAYTLEGNKLRVKELAGKIGDGAFRLSGLVDLGVRGLDYSLELRLDQVPLKSMATELAPYYQSPLDGTVSASCSLNGNGVTPLRFIKNLTGDGVFTVRDALIQGLPGMGSIASFIRMDGGDGLRFDQAQLKCRLQGGTVDVDGALTNPDLGLYPSGQVGIDGTLNVDTTMKISPALAGKMVSEKIRQFLPQEDGWTVLPIEVRGTVYNPRVSLSKETLNIFIEKVLPAVLNEMLKDKAGQ
jgi:AsmA protein